MCAKRQCIEPGSRSLGVQQVTKRVNNAPETPRNPLDCVESWQWVWLLAVGVLSDDTAALTGRAGCRDAVMLAVLQ
jgi:hypothetical protein